MIVGAKVVCVHACAWRASPIGKRLAELGEVLRVEERRVPLGPEVDTFDEAAPRVVNERGRLELGEAAHDLGRGHERVVGAERLRRVTRCAVHRDAAPVRALLADDHRQARTARRRHLEAAGLGDDVVGHDRVALVLDEVLGAPRAEVLLVGDREIHERAAA